MPVTSQQIANAATALDLQRLQATMQLERGDEERAFRAALLENEAAKLAALQNETLNRGDQLFLGLYKANIETRKTAITSTTTDAVIDDMAADAMRMTTAVYPAAKTALGLA